MPSDPKRSPSALSTTFLREQGYVVELAERWIPGPKIRKDFLGLFDLLAIHPNFPGVLGIQVTSRSNAASRRQKMQEAGHLSLWLQCGNRAVLHSWKRSGPRGNLRWEVKVEAVSV